MLDKLCWSFAFSGERFYPYDLTAAECIDTFEEADGVDVSEFARGQEYGKHGERWEASVEFFDTMEMHGYDPIERAERYREKNDLPEIDYTWYNDTRGETTRE